MTTDRIHSRCARIVSALLAGAAMTAILATAAAAAPGHRGARVGLGKVLTTKDGGQIFGFDINQAGDDGILATARPA